MLDAKFSTRKVRKLLKRFHGKPKITKDMLAEHITEAKTPMQQKIHELKQTLPFAMHEEHAQYSEKMDALQQLISGLARTMEAREERIENIQLSLRDMHGVIEKIMSYEEEEKKIKLSAKTRHLQQVEAQLARFEARLTDAAKRYHDEELFPIKQRIAELKEKYRQLKEKEREEPAAIVAKEEEIAEELKKKIAELELPPQMQEAERRIEDEVKQIEEEISAQEVTLDLPDFVVKEDEELSLPPPFPELLAEAAHEEEIPAPPILARKKNILDTAIAEMRRFLSRA